MAYINKNDFSIVGYVDDFVLEDEYFECDDLIAPAISLLNKKGYNTEFCCSGHPYSTIDSSAVTEYPSDELKKEMNIIFICSSKKSYSVPAWVDKNNYPYYISCLTSNPEGLYVTFKEMYEFPELPDKAFVDQENGGIYWNIEEPSTNDFNMVTRIYEMNKAFYEWVEKLPSLI